ncbi:MAG: hypothetical protein U9R49_07730, partial [Bacteroidota bacterium]|nr:hypothetical protein [Bacteroidota bacterium]
MKEQKKGTSRRDFFKSGALATIPLMIPAAGFGSVPDSEAQHASRGDGPEAVNFIYDGPMFSPQDYLEKLNEIDQADPIQIDYYSSG